MILSQIGSIDINHIWVRTNHGVLKGMLEIFNKGGHPICHWKLRYSRILRLNCIDYIEASLEKRVHLVKWCLKRKHLYGGNGFSPKENEKVKVLYELGIK